MSQATIAVDLDDVLAMHAASFVSFSNQRFGTSFKTEDYDDDWRKLWVGADWDEILRRADEFQQYDTTLEYGKIEEASPVLTNLKDKYRLVIVTARPKHLIDVTHEWLARHHADVFEAVHFVPIWEPNNTVTKADICQQIGASYLIDDSVRHCNIAVSDGIVALLFGSYKHHNTDIDERVIRVPTWQKVQEYFDGQR